VHTIIAFCVFLRIGLFVFVQVSEVLGQAISRKSVTGSWQLTGKDVTLHSLSRQDLNGKKAVCGRLNPVKMRYAVKNLNCDSNDGHKEQELLIHLRNIRVVKTSLQGLRVILKVCVRVCVAYVFVCETSTSTSSRSLLRPARDSHGVCVRVRVCVADVFM